MVRILKVHFGPEEVDLTSEGTELKVEFIPDPDREPSHQRDGSKYYGTLRVRAIGSVSGGSYEIPKPTKPGK